MTETHNGHQPAELLFADDISTLFAQLPPEHVEQFYQSFHLWTLQRRIETLRLQIDAVQQAVADNAHYMEQAHPSPIALSTLAQLQASGVEDIDLLDRMLERGDTWLDHTMQLLARCEELGVIQGDYASWCEHALEGAYEWIASMNEAAEATGHIESTTASEPFDEATEGLLLQKLMSEEDDSERRPAITRPLPPLDEEGELLASAVSPETGHVDEISSITPPEQEEGVDMASLLAAIENSVAFDPITAGADSELSPFDEPVVPEAEAVESAAPPLTESAIIAIDDVEITLPDSIGSEEATPQEESEEQVELFPSFDETLELAALPNYIGGRPGHEPSPAAHDAIAGTVQEETGTHPPLVASASEPSHELYTIAAAHATPVLPASSAETPSQLSDELYTIAAAHATPVPPADFVEALAEPSDEFDTIAADHATPVPPAEALAEPSDELYAVATDHATPALRDDAETVATPSEEMLAIASTHTVPMLPTPAESNTTDEEAMQSDGAAPEPTLHAVVIPSSPYGEPTIAYIDASIAPDIEHEETAQPVTRREQEEAHTEPTVLAETASEELLEDDATTLSQHKRPEPIWKELTQYEMSIAQVQTGTAGSVPQEEEKRGFFAFLRRILNWLLGR